MYAVIDKSIILHMMDVLPTVEAELDKLETKYEPNKEHIDSNNYWTFYSPSNFVRWQFKNDN